MDAQTRLRHSPDATVQEVAGEAILIHLQTGVYYSLNDVGTAFWNLLDGALSIEACAQSLAAEYNAPADVVLADLLELAADLHKEGLVAR
ncbi:MAG: PqqD family protein [Anaerolineales bacterium]|nr:PqqD family protein [Anaerolineales bacterium]